MGDNIDSLLNQLQKSIDNSKSEIQVSVKEDELTENQGDNLIERLDKQNKKIKKTKKDLSNEEISERIAQLQIEKYQRAIRKLNKQAGVKGKDMTKVGKAQPRPSNDNPNNVRCFIRYNNQGNPYRVCSGNEPSSGFSKPPDQITPPIPVEEFLDKLGKTYGELTEGQRREYHRIDMANRRFNDRALQEPIRDTLDSVLQEQRRLGGFIAQEQRLKEKQEQGELRLKKKEIDNEYKKLLKENNLSRKTARGKQKQDLLRKAGLTDKLSNQFDKAGLKTDFKESINVSFDIKDNQKKIKEVKKTKEQIRKDIKKQQKELSKKVESSGKEVIVSFDD